MCNATPTAYDKNGNYVKYSPPPTPKEEPPAPVLIPKGVIAKVKFVLNYLINGCDNPADDNGWFGTCMQFLAFIIVPTLASFTGGFGIVLVVLWVLVALWVRIRPPQARGLCGNLKSLIPFSKKMR